MIMGLGSLLDDWADADTKLAYDLGHRPVLVFDNRGVGGSTLNRSHLTVHRMASDALALAFHVFGASAYFHVFGVSMGGMIAQEMALLNEDRDKDSKFLASVVLGCTQHGGPDATPPGDEFILTLMHPPRVDLMSSREEKQAALRKHYERMTELNYTSEWVKANPEAFQGIVTRSMSGRRPFRALMAHSGAVGLFDTSSRLHKIKVPTLVVHGDQDVVLPVENGRKVAAMVSNSQLVEMRGIGHAFWGMNFAGLADIAKFLASVDASLSPSKL